MNTKTWSSFTELRQSAPKTARAWAIKEHAMCLRHYGSRTWAKKQWLPLLGWTRPSRPRPTRKLARTITSYPWGVVNAIVLEQSNGIVASVNNRIQRVKARTSGFRNREQLRTAILFHPRHLERYDDPVSGT